MTLTAKGFAGGPMTDADFGAIAAPGAWVEDAASFTVSQPNSGTRTASIAAGAAISDGVRVISDAATSQALASPGSGLQWYMIALRRDWGAKTPSVVALSGPATTETAAPSAPPVTLPATFKNTPGTGQQDQPLAWVAVLASTSTITVFDLRMRRSAHALIASTPHALVVLALQVSLPIGLRISSISDQLDYRWNGTSWDIVPGARTACLLQLNGAVSTGTNGGDLVWDTVLSDPSSMRFAPAAIRAPWNGRYAIGCRVALQGDIPPTDIVSLSAMDAAGVGAVFGAVGQWGLPGDQPMQYFDELTLTAGTVIRFRINWSGSSGARQFSYGSDAVRARIVMRFLGPA